MSDTESRSMQTDDLRRSGAVRRPVVEFLLSLLGGLRFATAIMPWGDPNPIALPDSTDKREKLVIAHLQGDPAEVTCAPIDREPQTIRVPALVFGAYCPTSHGLCRWLAFDLDAADGHGPKGLVDPVHAMRCISERASAAGVADGLVAARSKSGKGRHVWLVLSKPMALSDAVIAAAALAAAAHRVASIDQQETERPHAFRSAAGPLVEPGTSGGFEILPRSTTRPRLGWSLTLPASGAFARSGGGVLVDSFTDLPVRLHEAPRCDERALDCFIREAKAELRRRAKVHWNRPRTRKSINPIERLHPRTRELLDGNTPEGQRNDVLFASVMNMLGHGLDPNEVVRLAIDGGQASGLGDREIRATIKSALRQWERKAR